MKGKESIMYKLILEKSIYTLSELSEYCDSFVWFLSAFSIELLKMSNVPIL
jgi:hypothetical protein